uniref:RecF/RecN/SMC N-terminal domain-containing protein n=1 Tax=Piliocolobus tephrosceles TaxID=591936 RepID=A0A8C9GZ66_9PRIM
MQNKKKTNNKKLLSDYYGDDNQSDRSIDVGGHETSELNTLEENSLKLVDQDFNSFINNGMLDISITPSVDLSNSNITPFKTLKETKLRPLKNIRNNIGTCGYSDEESDGKNTLKKNSILNNNNGQKNRKESESNINIDNHTDNDESNIYEKEKDIYEQSPFFKNTEDDNGLRQKKQGKKKKGLNGEEDENVNASGSISSSSTEDPYDKNKKSSDSSSSSSGSSGSSNSNINRNKADCNMADCNMADRNMADRNKADRNKADRNKVGETKNVHNVNNINGNINESINTNDSKNDSNVTTGQDTIKLYQKQTNSSLVGATMSSTMVGKNNFYSEKSLNLKINDLSMSQDYLGSSNISMLSSNIPYKEEGLCFIKYIIVCNFKSYENENVIGPFSKFTAIIGPNGSGKSNLMDCICFVLGINNKYLRAKNLKNLIYHKENEKLDVISKRKCYVKLIVECNKENVEIKRTLNYKGVSNFYINEKLVDHKEYTTFLRKNRIETKTKTCLIFQGDIEDIINKKPTELAKLFEYISGSDEYEQIYEDVKEKLKEKQIACKNYLNDKKKIEQEIKLHKALINKNIEHSKMKEDYELEIKIYYLFRLYHYHKNKEKFKEMLLHLKDEKINFEEDVLSTNKNNANELERKRLLKKKEYLKIDDEIKNYKNELNKQKIGLNE